MWRKDPYLNQESVYKCPEPTQGVNFISNESKKLLADCLKDNTANPFFPLIDQYNTQTYGSYCGPVNISIVLNAFSVDSKVNLMRNFRWYNETNIHALDIEGVRGHGMTITDLLFLLQSNGLTCHLCRPMCENSKNFLYDIDIDSLKDNKNYYDKFYIYDDITKFKWTTITQDYLKKAEEDKTNFIPFTLVNEEFFRICCLSSCFYDNFYIMTNIQRMALGQKGGGHFMPIGAYHSQSDNVLLIDCARYKYNSRWQKISDLFQALTGCDSVTEKTRGFILMERPIKKNVLNIKIKDLVSIDEKMVEEFIGKLKFETQMDKATFINWMIVNHVHIICDDKNEIVEATENLWRTIIPKMYKNNKKFKEFVDFLFMFNRVNIKKLILGAILFLR